MPFDIPNTPKTLSHQICELRDPLITAVAFVGGPSGGHRAAAAIDALMARGPHSRLAQEQLRGVLKLLMLEDPAGMSAESALIPLWDPRIDDVLRLTDHFSDLLDALTRHTERTASQNHSSITIEKDLIQ